MKVIKAKKGDAKEISVCRQKAIKKLNSKGYSDKGLRDLLDNSSFSSVVLDLEDYEIFILVEDKNVIGTVSLGKNQIGELYVDPDYAGRGIGEKLLRFIEKYAKSKDISNIYLFSTLPSEGFYKKNGYKAMNLAISYSTKSCLQFVKMIKIL